MRWSLRCTSTGSQAVALPCGASSSATTSASKKSLRAAEQDRPDVARARRCWKRRQAMLNSTRLVFIDETAANTKMVRLSGRCPRGERLVGCVPQGHWKTLTFVAGPAPEWDDGAVRDRWLDERKDVPRICRAVSRSRGQTQRPGGHGQSSGTQSSGRTRSDRSQGRDASLSAPVLTGPESDRDAVQQTQGGPAQGR